MYDEIEDLDNRLDRLERRLDNNGFGGHYDTLDKLEESIEDLKYRVSDLEDENKKLKNVINNFKKENEKLENMINEFKEENDEFYEFNGKPIPYFVRDVEMENIDIEVSKNKKIKVPK